MTKDYQPSPFFRQAAARSQQGGKGVLLRAVLCPGHGGARRSAHL